MEILNFVYRLRSWAPLLAMSMICGAAQAQNTAAAPVDQQKMADQIQKEVAELRGLPFKRPIKAELQTTQQFGAYIDKGLQEEMPEPLAKHYGKFVRKMGFYNGPEIKDGRGMMKMVMTSQAGAYYDPDKQTFFVLMQNMPELMLGTLYSHELYHGLQDEYFDLNRYVLKPERQHELNADELLARQAVIEGEATYVMTLWMLKKMTGSVPAKQMLSVVVQQQVEMDMEMLRASLKQPQVAEALGGDLQAAMAAADSIPPYMLDTLIGAYMKGLGFIYAVQDRGWKEVEKLYGAAPPASSEQILHPEKWFANEVPTKIQWPAFNAPELRDWEVIDDNVLGEFRWRSIFKAQGLSAEANTLATGWDGDRYAVFKRKDSDSMLLLLYSCWDTEADAAKFATGYKKALVTKYAGAKETTRVVIKGKNVLLVEGGDESKIDSLLAFVDKAKLTKAH